MFEVYFKIGLKHIADLAAYDHILFIIALCAVYRIAQWKSILILVTAFTIGHSITLALSALNIVTMDSGIIEFLIPVTIVLTALYNIFFDSSKKVKASANVNFKYFIALFFGLIHGMGFSNYFKALLGSEANITIPLLAFNIGVEAGQLIIVGVLLAVGILIMEVFKVAQKSWNLFISGAAFGIAFTMMIDTWPF
jgi:hypothetical protein